MVTSFAGVQTDLSKVVHSSCRSFCHSSEPHSFFVCISGARPTSLRYRCSEHKLVGSHCVCLRSQGCPLQGDPKLQAAQLPDHCNSPRLAGDALVLGPSAALNRDPQVTSVNNTIPVRLPVSTTLLKQSHIQVFHSNLQLLNLHVWCLGVDNSKDKVSL